MMRPTTTCSISVRRHPAFRIISALSAVNIRVGRIYESTGKEPLWKALACKGTAYLSVLFWEVIWQSKISLPSMVARTNAGRFLEADKSEKGKGMTTISPFISLSMPSLLSRSTNLLPKCFRWQGALRQRRQVAFPFPSCRHVSVSTQPNRLTTVALWD